MNLRIRRTKATKERTIGRLEVKLDGHWIYLCDTLENRLPKYKKGSNASTALKPGSYMIATRVCSPLYSNYEKYPFAKVCHACMPRVVGADNDSVIRPQSREPLGSDIQVGAITRQDKLELSQQIWEALVNQYFMPAKRGYEKITLQIHSQLYPALKK